MSSSAPDRVDALAAEFELASLEPLIDACRATEGRGLDVAVVGRFKAGKSSLINGLAGREVLPVGVLPVTAVVVRLRCGSEERAVARFLDGTSRAVALAELGDFVSESGNPRNAKGVASVEAELPSLRPLAPLTFVDTPGLGSALAHGDAETMKWLPRVGTALVTVSCDAPLSDQDLVLLDALRRHTPRIDLLLTKADLLDDAQRAEVLDFVRGELRRRWGVEPAVRFYSVKPSCAGLREALVKDLLRPLARDHERAGAEVARHKTAALLERALDALAGRLDEVSRERLAGFLAPVRTVEASRRRCLQALRHRLAERVRAALGVDLPPREIALETPAPPAPPVRIGFVDAAFELLSPLVPMRLFRRPVESWLLQRTRWETEKNLSRLASGWSELLSESVRALTRETENRAALELSVLEQALAAAPARAPRLREAIAELERLRAGL